MTRFNSSTLLETDGAYYLFDAGTPAPVLMIRQNIEFRKLKAIFITHMHADHYAGLPDIIKHQAKHIRDNEYTQIWLPEMDAIEPMRNTEYEG